jgi:hypothetical protein
MSDLIKTFSLCGRCGGSKIISASSEDGPIEIPCESCSATGYFEVGNLDVTDLVAELSYIHGKVTAIWNKVK